MINKIELYKNNGEVKKLESIISINDSQKDFLAIQVQDYNQEDIEWVKENFNIDFTIMNNIDDIEISSHFYENDNQSAFHFSLPYFSKDNLMEEESLFVIITNEKIFVFMSSRLDKYLNEAYPFKLNVNKHNFVNITDMFKFHIGFISDYYADITQTLSKRIKNMAARVLVKKEFIDNDLDIITQLNFNNLLIKESLNEFMRILTLFKKSARQAKMDIREKIDNELNDLSVVSDYIQFNFDRLDDLKENISNKIELEQNRIFKILTITTVCIAMPTLVAGIYGMNFEVMPELKWKYGYHTALFAMFLSVIIPVLYFKKKKWL